MHSRIAALRSFLRATPEESVLAIAALALVFVASPVAIWSFPSWIPTGYIVPSMHIAAATLFIASAVFGLMVEASFSEDDTTGTYVVKSLFTIVGGMGASVAVFWLLGERDEALYSFFALVGLLGTAAGILAGLCWPSRWWWLGLRACAHVRYEVPR